MSALPERTVTALRVSWSLRIMIRLAYAPHLLRRWPYVQFEIKPKFQSTRI